MEDPGRGGMIVANLATYPPRRSNLLPVVEAIAGQVDRLNVVLNQYDGPLAEFERFETVRQILPETDTKDVGKFYPDVTGADLVLMIDDDLVYPPDYVARTRAAFEALGEGRYLGGYHASLYDRPGFTLWPPGLLRWARYSDGRIADHRKPFRFYEALDRPVIVDQVATNAAILRAADMPPYAYMKDSAKFVDVRLARWCHENGIRPAALPKPAGWLGQVRFEESIFHDFTRRNPPH